MGPLMTGKPMDEAFKYSDRQPQVCLVPLTDAGKAKLKGQKYKCIDAPKFYYMHAVNAFQTNTGVTIDLCSTADGSLVFGPMATLAPMRNKTMRDSYNSRQGIQRFTVTFDDTSIVKVSQLSPPGIIADMPHVNPNFIGKPYCVFYTQEFWHGSDKAAGEAYADMAVYRQNVCTGERRYFHRPALFPSEPYMIPTSETDEEDGVVVFPAFNGAKNSSSFIVLDAKTMKELGEIALPGRVPFTIHGDWFPGWQPKLSGAFDAEKLIIL